MIDTQQKNASTAMLKQHLDPKICSVIREHSKEIILAKGDSLRLGPCNNYYFVVEGLQCLYTTNESNKHLIDLVSPPYCTSTFQGISDQKINKYHLQCLSESRFFEISTIIFEKLLYENRCFERYMRELAERKLAEIFERYHQNVALSIEDRFRSFLQNKRELLQKVPHKYLASYLNMHPTNFSKLLGKIRI